MEILRSLWEAESLPASIFQTISRDTWAIYHSEPSTGEGSTWRWSSGADSRINTLEHYCPSSWPALLGNPSVASWWTSGQTPHLEEGTTMLCYLQEPMLSVTFFGVFDELNRWSHLQNRQLSNINFHRTRAGSCNLLGPKKEKKICVFKAVEMPEVPFVEVKRINSSANTTESECIGYKLHIILKDKIRPYFIPTDKIKCVSFHINIFFQDYWCVPRWI